MPFRSYLVHGFRLLICALAAVWVLDIVLSLRLPYSTYMRIRNTTTFGDFLGLFLTAAPIAIVSTVVSWMASVPLLLIPSAGHARRASVITLSTALTGITLYVAFQMHWSVAVSRHPMITLAVLLPCLWIALNALTRKCGETWRIDEILQWILSPSLILGCILLVVIHGISRPGAFWGAMAFAFLMLLAIADRSRHASVVLLARTAPFVFACALTLICLSMTSLYSKSRRMEGTSAGEGHPDIVLIVLDTVGAGHLKMHGYDHDTMPALERWAESALVARRAVSPAGWTSPAHASIFTGRTVSGHGVHYASEDSPGNPILRTPPYEEVTWLPDQLAQYGYRSLAVTSNRQAVPPEIVGFDRVLLPIRQIWSRITIGTLGERASASLRRFSERLRWRTPYADAEQMVDLTMRAVPPYDGPMFLFVNFMDAHAPYNPPDSALELLGVSPETSWNRYHTHRGLMHEWDTVNDDRRQTLIDLYDAELRWLDINLDRLLRWIDERFGEDTAVIVTSDHGEELGEENRIGHEYGLSQALVHVPLIVRSPHIAPGKLDSLITLQSLYSFIEDLGAGRQPGAEGLLRIREANIVSERYSSKYNSGTLGPDYKRAWVSMFEGPYKGVGPPEDGFELLDIDSEGFTREVPVNDQEAADALRERIDLYWRNFRDPRDLPEDTPGLSEEELEQLRSLGYID